MLHNINFNSKNQKKLLPVTKQKSTSLCALCRGTKLLCGRSRCPVLVKFHSRDKVKTLVDKLKLGGSSPPSVFVGRFGYPKVSIGPMIPPVMGNTSLIDTPELWLDKSIDDIVDFRSMLIRGKYDVDVFDVENPNKIVGFTRELALSKNSVFTEAIFEKKPRGNIAFYDEAQPHGPSAPLKKFDITNPKYEQHMEKAFYDTDLKARDAVSVLYKDGVNISKIQRAFSVGAFGVNKYRRFVPTRWSITAVDSLLGKELMKKTKARSYINEFRIYHLNQFDNRWIVLMMPSEWQYELIEAWYPNTTWNLYGKNISIFNSYEFYKGRTTYADIGGCYYAARLAVNELLNKERRQAGVVILREAHPGYIMPIGVWNVRESVRRALQQDCRKFDTLDKAIVYVSEKMDIPVQRWIRNSALLKDQLYQKRIEDF
ncbi:MAG: Nre family DNA repair protein [Candidatus Thermoplasmatota archaeon]|nr:Nre family DNA repair protein [Candidatus Thermoplasmatota archaeon]